MDETWSAKARSILADVDPSTASTRRLAAAHSITPSSRRFLRQSSVFRAFVVRIRPQFDQPVPHRRAKGVRQGRDADSKPLGQCLERSTIVAAKAVDLRKQPELSVLEVRRGNRLVVQMAELARRAPQSGVRAGQFTQHAGGRPTSKAGTSASTP